MIRTGSMPTCSQKSASPPSTTGPAGAATTSSSSPDSSASSSSVSSRSSETSSSSGSYGCSSSSAASLAARSSTSGVVTTSSIAAITSSQLRATISAMPFHRFCPARPANCSMPPATRPRLGLPLKKRVTAGSSHTVPIDDTTASVFASWAMDSSVGFSASNSSTAMRSARRFSVGSSVCALAVLSRAQPG